MHLVFAAGFLVPQKLIGIEYFRDTRAEFPHALFPAVDPTASIDRRAAMLADAIDTAFPNGPIHVIAHSMAGLDTRRLLTLNLRGLADRGRIVALSTISTPHRGSPIADLLVGPKPDALDLRAFNYRVLESLTSDLGLHVEALGDLTSGAAATFNRQNPDRQTVAYFSYAGGAQESVLLKPAHLYIDLVGRTGDERANDGLVSLASALWGRFVGPPWPTDHIGEVGHTLNPPRFVSEFDHNTAYREMDASAAAAVAS